MISSEQTNDQEKKCGHFCVWKMVLLMLPNGDSILTPHWISPNKTMAMIVEFLCVSMPDACL